MTQRATLRPYAPRDLPAIYDICLRTGNSGADATDLYPDPDLLGSVFAAPYATLEPELTFVIDDGQRAVGYVLGTADTARFVRRFRQEWLPTVAQRFPEPTGEPRTQEERVRSTLHHPESMSAPPGYPAHLHIDLLPSHQHGGYGRELITRFLAALHEREVEGVYLVMGKANTNADAFYRRLGFHELAVPGADTVTFFGRDTTPPA